MGQRLGRLGLTAPPEARVYRPHQTSPELFGTSGPFDRHETIVLGAEVNHLISRPCCVISCVLGMSGSSRATQTQSGDDGTHHRRHFEDTTLFNTTSLAETPADPFSIDSSFLEAALAYASRGFAVLPLKPRDKVPLALWSPTD